MQPLAACGIELKGYRVTKRQLKAWTETNTPHVVMLYTLGGIFTSKGDGVYESNAKRFESLDDFWLFAREHKQNKKMMEL